MKFIPKQTKLDDEVISYWLKKTRWTRSEFAALYCGVNPYVYNEESVPWKTRTIEQNLYDLIKDLEKLISDRLELEGYGNTPQGWRSNLIKLEIPERDWMSKILIPAEAVDKAVKNVVSEKVLHPKERDSLLLIIAALCKNSEINPNDRGVANKISNLAVSLGAPIDEDTVRDYLKLIPAAVERRSK